MNQTDPRYRHFVQILREDIRGQLKIFHDQSIRHLHHLGEHGARILADADVVAQALAHLLHPVNSLQKRHEHGCLGFLLSVPLQLPPHQNIKGLVSPP